LEISPDLLKPFPLLKKEAALMSHLLFNEQMDEKPIEKL